MTGNRNPDGTFKKGVKHPYGGSDPRKRTFQHTMRKKIEEAGVLDDLIALATGEPDRITGKPLEPALRIKVLEKLANKVLPDLKAVDMKVDTGRPLVIIKDLTGMKPEQLPAIEDKAQPDSDLALPVIDAEPSKDKA